MRARWAKRSIWAACFREGSLMDEEECSRRRRRVRAYSRFCVASSAPPPCSGSGELRQRSSSAHSSNVAALGRHLQKGSCVPIAGARIPDRLPLRRAH